MSPETTAITVAADHPKWNEVGTALEQRLPSIQAFLGGNEAAADRFRRVVLQSIVKNPDLLNATVESLTSAAAEAAQLGLEPSGAVGGAHIVRFGTKAQLLIDYRGLVELARRSELIEDIWAAVVRERDSFSVKQGLRPDLEHEPAYDADRTPNPDQEGNRVVHVYAVAVFRSGHRRFEVMSRTEVEAIRSRSRAANAGPWVTDWQEMAKKTVLRRLCKTLPLQAVAKQAIAEDEEREYAGGRAVVSDVPAQPTGSLAERLARRRVLTEPPQTGEQGGDVEASANPATTPPAGTEPEAAGDPPPSGSPAPRRTRAAARAASCTHPSNARENRKEGIVCTSCGTILAQRTEQPATRVEAAGGSGPAAARGRSRSAQSDEGKAERAPARSRKGTGGPGAAAHAAAAELGLDHEMLRPIAAALLNVAPADLADFSMADLVPAEWDALAEHVRSLPTPLDEDAVTMWVQAIAQAHGLNDWPDIDPLVTVATGKDPAALTPAEWVVFGTALRQGAFDKEAVTA